MIRNLFEQMSSRHEWLRSAGLGASIAVLPAAVASGAVLGKDDALQDIMHLIKIHAPSERVYEAITTAAGIRQWWTRDVAIEPKVGAAGEFGFNGKRFVEELNPVTRVRWKVPNSAWQGNDIEFDLKTDGNDTTLIFAPSAAGSAADDLSGVPEERRHQW
jgi:hypothetical protein